VSKIIDISGGIGYEVNKKEFRNKLESAKGDDIIFNIASPGGLVYDGIEIYNSIRDYKRNNPDAKITAAIKGLAASMATYIASHEVFDEILAEDNAVYMIHNPLTGTYGDYREMYKTANLLDNLAKILSKAYHHKTGKDIDNIRKMMDDETWLFGEEIKEAGFVDGIIKTDNDKDKESALTNADLKVKALFSEMKKDESYNDSLLKAAAFLNIENDFEFQENEIISEIQNPEAPYPNEHSLRMRNPGDFADNPTWKKGYKAKFLRVNDDPKKLGPGKKPIDKIIGKLKGKSGINDPSVAQAYRFRTQYWTIDQVRAWIKEKGWVQGTDYVRLEPAKPASQSGSYSDDYIPADGGTNLEEADMTLEELKKQNPDLYAEIKQAGVEEEQKRVAEILAWKEKPEYKRHPAVLAKIDECIKDKCDRTESLTLISAVLTNGNIQASFESPDGISVGNGKTGSGETAAETNTTQEA